MGTLVSLDIEDLSCIRGHRVLFRALNVAVGAGQALSVEGPNGAGKTSLLRLIAGFLRPAAGTIRLRIKNGVVDDTEERGKFVGWLSHQDAVKPQLHVREQLAFWARLYNSAGEPDAAMEAFGLTPLADLPGQYLSAGQKRRLALARLRLSNRALWLLDEPLAALDSAGKALLATAVTQHCAEGGIVLAATHDPLGIACGKLDLGGAR